MDIVSNCCSAGAQGFEDYGLCPACKEHCDFIDLDMIEHQEGFIEGLEWALKYYAVCDGNEFKKLLKDKIEEIESEIQ